MQENLNIINFTELTALCSRPLTRVAQTCITQLRGNVIYPITTENCIIFWEVAEKYLKEKQFDFICGHYG